MALNENSNGNNRLQELGDSDFKIIEGQPDIKGWTVKDGMGRTIGEVDELLFDPQSRQVRYIVLDMDDNELDLDDRDVLIPIGLAELDERDDDVILPNVTTEQLRSLPEYDDDYFSEDIEAQVRTVFSGAGAAGAVTGASFYDHDHFKENNLYRRRQGNKGEAQTVIGIFDNGFEAQNAFEQLKSNGFDEDQIDLSVRGNAGNDNDTDDDSGISNFFGNLMGNDDSASHYTEVAKRGSIVTVHARSGEEAQRAARILDQYGAVDVDERYNQYQNENSTASNTEKTIPIIKEKLQVGKKEVETGTVRLRSKIIERPVEESIRLRSERVAIERNPVDRPATESDLTKEGAVEQTEHTEVPVVGKEARVVEEVSLNRTVEETDETIRDTVRDTEVDVEKSDSDEELRRRTNRNE
jgi:uncharacterized protein (TIGR02271 family)